MKLFNLIVVIFSVIFSIEFGFSCGPEEVFSEKWDSCKIIGMKKKWVHGISSEEDFGVLGTPLYPGYSDYYLVFNRYDSAILISELKENLGSECQPNSEDENFQFQILCRKKAENKQIEKRIFLTFSGKIKIDECFFYSKKSEWLKKVIIKIYSGEV